MGTKKPNGNFLDHDGFLDVNALISHGMVEKFFPDLINNLKCIRKSDFPLLEKRIYLDSGATSQEPLSVIKKMYEYRKSKLRGSNHSENNEEAKRAQEMLDSARKKVQTFFNAENYYVAFTSGTTASSNMLSTRFNFKQEDLLLITEMEHNSQILTARNFAKLHEADVKYVPILLPGGELDSNALEKIISERKSGKILLMISHVSNVTGVVNPIKKIKSRFGKRISIYLDMAQSAGHLPIDLDNLDVDFAGASAHKVYGPMGIGAFFVKKENDKYINNMMSGGSAVELVAKNHAAYKQSPKRLEPGTQNIEGAIEWGFAVDYLNEIGMKNIEAHDKSLGAYFVSELKKIPEVKLYCSGENRKSPIVIFNIGESETNYEKIAKELDKKGISVRDGCFCAHLYLPPILGVPSDEHDSKIERFAEGFLKEDLKIKGAVRVSFAFYNTPLDAYKSVCAVREITKTFEDSVKKKNRASIYTLPLLKTQMEKDCVETKKSDSGEMSVKICTMLDTCDCGSPNCCSKKMAKRNKEIS